MNISISPTEANFWNSNEIVNYFAEKPADPIVVERISQINDPQYKLALDLGCGGGRHSEAMARAGFKVTSADLTPEMLYRTQQRLSNAGLEANAVQMSIESLPFEDESFDVVVSTGVLHQAKSLTDYDKTLGEVSRVLKPNGLLTMNIFTDSVWDETYTVPDPENEPHTVLTRDGLWMTLLSKDDFYKLAESNSLSLEQEVTEDIRQENTGPRAVLRAHLIKN